MNSDTLLQNHQHISHLV